MNKSCFYFILFRLLVTKQREKMSSCLDFFLPAHDLYVCNHHLINVAKTYSCSCPCRSRILSERPGEPATCDHVVDLSILVTSFDACISVNFKLLLL